MPATPVEDAEQVLRRFASFRRLGFDELDAKALASADVTFHAVVALVKKGCPKHLTARILT
jgi:hypothetical protein